MPDIRVRPMRLEDVPQVCAIDRASFASPWSEKTYRFEILRNRVSLPLVAEETETQQVIGMVVMWQLLDEMHIATIGVHPDWRRRGVGRRLLASALLTGMYGGGRIASLEVRVSNLPAQALYRHFGFQVMGRRLRYYQDNHEDALMMTATELDEPLLRRYAPDVPSPD